MGRQIPRHLVRSRRAIGITTLIDAKHKSVTKEKKLRIRIVSFVILATLVACGEGSDSPTAPRRP